MTMAPFGWGKKQETPEDKAARLEAEARVREVEAHIAQAQAREEGATDRAEQTKKRQLEQLLKDLHTPPKGGWGE
jgi:hypothetical protein